MYPSTHRRSCRRIYRNTRTAGGGAADFIIKVAIFPTERNPPRVRTHLRETPRRGDRRPNRCPVVSRPPTRRTLPEMVDGVQIGTIESACCRRASSRESIRVFKLPTYPDCSTTSAHISRALSCPDFREPFMRLAEDKGMIGVAIFDYGPTAYASIEPIPHACRFQRQEDSRAGNRCRTSRHRRVWRYRYPDGHGQRHSRAAAWSARRHPQYDRCAAALKFYDVARYITLVEDTHIPDMA